MLLEQISTSQAVVWATERSKSRKGDTEQWWGWLLFNTEKVIFEQRFGGSDGLNHMFAWRNGIQGKGIASAKQYKQAWYI